jgi:hypothetical protein
MVSRIISFRVFGSKVSGFLYFRDSRFLGLVFQVVRFKELEFKTSSLKPSNIEYSKT